jgi:cytochrome P450
VISPTQLPDPAVLDEPYDFYRLLREQAPVWVVPGADLVVVRTFELVAEVASRTVDFSSRIRCLLCSDDDGAPLRLAFGDAALPTLATADPPQHSTHRKAVFPELVAGRMRTLEDDIVALSEQTVREALQSTCFDFMTAVANLVPITIISRLIGVRDSDPMTLLGAAFDSTAMLGATLPLGSLTDKIERIVRIQEWVQDQIRTAVEGPDEGILLTVRRAVDASTLEEGEAVTVLHTLLSAGGETTTSLIGNAVSILAGRPDLQARLREVPELVDLFVEEVLRLGSPFRHMMRSVPTDTTLGGVDIAEGSTVLLLWGAVNRDPAEFERPDEIDLEREAPRRHFVFGHGIHYCVGAALARIEGRAVLSTLLQQTEFIALDPDQPPQWAQSLLVRRHERLPLLVTPLSSSKGVSRALS